MDQSKYVSRDDNNNETVQIMWDDNKMKTKQSRTF